MRQILLVGAGGFLGTVSRYVLGGWVHHVLTNTSFPYGTLVVNAVGCFLIGLLSGLAESRSVFGPEVRLFVFIGVLGGFTTYSSFAYETFALARETQYLAAAANLLAQMILGLAGVWFGNVFARIL
jgi:CrcB protein